MTREEAINVLKTTSCYECSWGCDSPVSCHCGGCDLAEATRIAIESLEVFEWAPVTERLPLEFLDRRILVSTVSPTGRKSVDIGLWLGGKWTTYFPIGDDKVTAWMPLPEPYKGGEV